MKKFLAIFLALMMVCTVALVSCKKDTTDDEGDNWDNEGYDNIDNSSDSSTGSDSGTGTDTGSGNGASGNAWIDKNDTVYTGMAQTNLREGPGSGYKVGKVVAAGTALSRTGTNGSWDKVKYQDVEYYVVSDLVTTDGKDFSFGADLAEPVSLTIKEGCQINLRATPFYSESYKDDNVAKSGLASTSISTEKPLLKVAVSESGEWYKVTYDGGTYYLAASSVSSGYVIDPSATVGGNGGGTAIG